MTVPPTHANGAALLPLRPTARQDKIARLADAMRGILTDPGTPGTRQELAAVVHGCTDDEYEAAWSLVQPEAEAATGVKYQGAPRGARMLPVIPAARAAAPAPAPPPQRDHLLRDVLAAFASALRAVSGDMVITWAMTATVAVVAVDAAIVSYSHIYDLATGAPGSGVETGIQPRLLPLSIDGVIAEASLVLLYAARHRITPAPRLARFMLVLGIVATVAANVTHGLPSALLSPVTHVVISALLSAWPAGAFIGSVEMAMGLVRAIRAIEAGDSGDDSDSDTEGDGDSDTETAETAGHGGGGGDKKPPDTRRRKTTPDPVTAAIKKGWDDDKIIAKFGVTKRTIQRRRKGLEGAGGG